MVCFVVVVVVVIFSKHMSKKNHWPHLLLAPLNMASTTFYQSRTVDRISNSLPSAQGQQFCSHSKKMPLFGGMDLFFFAISCNEGLMKSKVTKHEFW